MRRNSFLVICAVVLIVICMLDALINIKFGKEEEVAQQEEQIRVLIRSDSFASEYHEAITVSSEADFWIDNGNEKNYFEANTCLKIDSSDTFFDDTDILYLESENGNFLLPDLVRDQESPRYYGKLEIRKEETGLLLINELLLEEYLCSVVPSEMPPAYPEEALKAQAVCARTYAKKQKEEGRMEELYADVDDSVSYQVYNNQPRDERTDRAVWDTEGVVLQEEGELIDAWYYSTSCGMDFSVDLSGEAVFAAFLSENNLRAYEAEEPWYRWETEIYLEDFEDVIALEVQKRNESGRADALRITRNADGILQDEILEGEYQIRAFLNSGNPAVTLQDGNRVEGMTLLPSAFFIMNPLYEEHHVVGYHLYGGGYGHGNGMSQNGAKAMAKDGFSYREILENYYGTGSCLAKEEGT